MWIAEFVEMLSILNEEKVDFVIVGGYAVGIYLEPRATKDLDIFIRPSKKNAANTIRALRRFGAPMFGVTVADLSSPGLVLQIGIPPKRIDFLTSISGATFSEAWRSRVGVQIAGMNEAVPFIGKKVLIQNKRSAARPQDLVDADQLERTRRSR